MASPDECLFCRIVAGDEAADIVARDDDVVVFKDKFPRAPVHLLVVPTEHLTSAHELSARHRDMVWECIERAQEVAADAGIADGYRIVTNIGAGGGQVIPHLHFHVLGGKQLGYVDGATDAG